MNETVRLTIQHRTQYEIAIGGRIHVAGGLWLQIESIERVYHQKTIVTASLVLELPGVSQ